MQLGLGLQSLVSRYITFGPEIGKLKKNWAEPRTMARVARGVHPPLLVSDEANFFLLPKI